MTTVAETYFRIPSDIAVEYGLVDTAWPVNSPHYVYRPFQPKDFFRTDEDGMVHSNQPPDHLICDHWVEVPYAISQGEQTISCPICILEGNGGPRLKRTYTVPNYAVPWQPHFNHAAGIYAPNKRTLKSHYSRLSDARSERIGMDHQFVMMEHGDMRDEGSVTDEGLDATRRRMQDSGETPSKVSYFTP
jgi:hypothetical protein